MWWGICLPKVLCLGMLKKSGLKRVNHKFSFHDEGYSVIRFRSKKDKDLVVMTGPLMFFG